MVVEGGAAAGDGGSIAGNNEDGLSVFVAGATEGVGVVTTVGGGNATLGTVAGGVATVDGILVKGRPLIRLLPKPLDGVQPIPPPPLIMTIGGGGGDGIITVVLEGIINGKNGHVEEDGVVVPAVPSVEAGAGTTTSQNNCPFEMRHDAPEPQSR